MAKWKVCRYKPGNKESLIKEWQRLQWPKEKNNLWVNSYVIVWNSIPYQQRTTFESTPTLLYEIVYLTNKEQPSSQHLRYCMK